MRSMLVIGAGRFGKNLAIKLTELHNEVMLVDMDEEALRKLEPFVTRVQIGDCMDKDVLRELGVSNFDVCFVCITITFNPRWRLPPCSRSRAHPMWSRNPTVKSMPICLKKSEPNDVVYPERDMAQRTAVRYSARGAFDYIELSPEYAIMEITAPEGWLGRNIREVNVPHQARLNVIGVRTGKHILPLTSADHVFSAQEHIIVAGAQKDILKIMKSRNSMQIYLLSK
jgi:trk system potassium uptake protein TrkA